MKIVICGSIDFTPKIAEVADELVKQGHQVEIPLYTQKIIAGELSLADFTKEKEKSGDQSFRDQAGEDLIKRYYRLIEKADAILVVNIDKKGIKNYIGGNTFLEMGFAHVLGKKIFLLNEIPEMGYKDELKAIKPVILQGDISHIRQN